MTALHALTVGELKTNFSEVLERVKGGESIRVLYGRARKPVAQIVPIETECYAGRPLGLYAKQIDFVVNSDAKFGSYEEFLGEKA